MSCRSEPAYISMLAPFLRYLYCEPQRQPQHTLLRHSLLRVLLPTHRGAGSVLQDKDRVETSLVSDSLLHCLCQMLPYMQVTHSCCTLFWRSQCQKLPQINCNLKSAFTSASHSPVFVGQNEGINKHCPLCWQVDSMEAVLELCGFVDVLLQSLIQASEEQWRTERTGLLLQLLCACQRCLGLNGDCRPLLCLMQQLLPCCQRVRIFFSFINSCISHSNKHTHTRVLSCSDHYCLFRSCHWRSC